MYVKASPFPAEIVARVDDAVANIAGDEVINILRLIYSENEGRGVKRPRESGL